MTSYNGITLLVPQREDTERAAVEAAWSAGGGSVLRLDRFWDPPTSLAHDRVCLYGTQTFCLVVAEKLDLRLVSPADDLVAKLDQRWLGRTVRVATLAEAMDGNFPVFAKPVTPKLFAAGVCLSADDLRARTSGVELNTPVIVSEPVRFSAEARCLVLNGKVLSAAVYEGDADVGDAAEFATRFAPAYSSAPITYVVDVGLMDAGQWSVVELNPVWGSGLNGCSPNAMARCVAAATQAKPIEQ